MRRSYRDVNISKNPFPLCTSGELNTTIAADSLRGYTPCNEMECSTVSKMHCISRVPGLISPGLRAPGLRVYHTRVDLALSELHPGFRGRNAWI